MRRPPPPTPPRHPASPSATQGGREGRSAALRDCTLQLSNSPTHICRRASSPRVHVGHRASRPSCSFCSERACGTLGEKPLSRPPASQAGIPHVVRKSTTHGRWFSPTSEVAKTEPGPRKQPFACVPHADGFVGLLDVPGLATYASFPPFVRAVARTCTRAVRPLHRRLPRPLWR